MARYKVIVAYDGSRYGGWQKQINTNSIQEEIERALMQIHQKPIEVVGSGRTDALVHALAQVFHFDSDKMIDEEHWKSALNALLPKDIRIKHVQEVDENFHARFHATSKRYDYYVTNEVDNPFLECYMAKEVKNLDIDMMKEASKIFLGTHDFTSFTSNRIDPRKPRTKTITRIDIIKEAHAIHMIFEGSGFLRYMVRMIAQTLIEVGKHRLTIPKVQAMLDAKSKHACKYKAPPQGLYLVCVNYEDKEVK